MIENRDFWGVFMDKILNTYYADNAKKLHKIVDKILLKFGGLSDQDRDDFYSLANELLDRKSVV